MESIVLPRSYNLYCTRARNKQTRKHEPPQANLLRAAATTLHPFPSPAAPQERSESRHWSWRGGPRGEAVHLSFSVCSGFVAEWEAALVAAGRGATGSTLSISAFPVNRSFLPSRRQGWWRQVDVHLHRVMAAFGAPLPPPRMAYSRDPPVSVQVLMHDFSFTSDL